MKLRTHGYLSGFTAHDPQKTLAMTSLRNISPNLRPSREEPRGIWSLTFPRLFQPQHLSYGYFHSQEQRSFLFSKWREPTPLTSHRSPSGRAGGTGGQHVGLLLPPTQTLRGGVWLVACCRVLGRRQKLCRTNWFCEPEAKPSGKRGKGRA